MRRPSARVEESGRTPTGPRRNESDEPQQHARGAPRAPGSVGRARAAIVRGSAEFRETLTQIARIQHGFPWARGIGQRQPSAEVRNFRILREAGNGTGPFRGRHRRHDGLARNSLRVDGELHEPGTLCLERQCDGIRRRCLQDDFIPEVGLAVGIAMRPPIGPRLGDPQRAVRGGSSNVMPERRRGSALLLQTALDVPLMIFRPALSAGEPVLGGACCFHTAPVDGGQDPAQPIPPVPLPSGRLPPPPVMTQSPEC